MISVLVSMADQSKLDKLKKLRELGINPYPYSFNQTHHAEEIRNGYAKLEGKSVSAAGRMIRMRSMGKLYFIDILDGSGKIQVLAREDRVNPSAMQILKFSDIGDIIGVNGTVTKTQKGEISIEAKEITMLSKSLSTLPEKFHGLSDIETRYRKRHLDLIINPDVRKVFRDRRDIISYIRDFLDRRGYLEVETPVLQSVYGGANAKPFKTHHNALDADLFLRISDELYLKRLIIGGIERVYEFSRDFRNEDVDSTHNPEFTLLEFYEAYGDYNTFMGLTEELLSGLAKKMKGGYEFEYQGKPVNFKPPFKRIYFVEEIKKKTGIDISEMSDRQAEEIADKEHLKIPVKNNYHVADALFDKYIKSDLWNPSFLLDYPAYMCHLTKDKRGNPKLSERFELFICNKEICNSYSELTDPIEQREKFNDQVAEKRKGDDEMPPFDEDFLDAMEYGMPPTAGIGIGIDRLVMLLTDNVSIKEILLFPSVRPEKNQAKDQRKEG